MRHVAPGRDAGDRRPPVRQNLALVVRIDGLRRSLDHGLGHPAGDLRCLRIDNGAVLRLEAASGLVNVLGRLLNELVVETVAGCSATPDRRKNVVDGLDINRVVLTVLVAAFGADMLLQEVRQVRIVLLRRVFVLEQ